MGYSGKDKNKRKKMEAAAKKIREAHEKMKETATIKNTKKREGRHSLAGTRHLRGEDVRSFIPKRKPKPEPKPETNAQKEARGRMPSSSGSGRMLSSTEWHAKYRNGNVSQSSLAAYRGYKRGFAQGKAK